MNSQVIYGIKWHLHKVRARLSLCVCMCVSSTEMRKKREREEKSATGKSELSVFGAKMSVFSILQSFSLIPYARYSFCRIAADTHTHNFWDRNFNEKTSNTFSLFPKRSHHNLRLSAFIALFTCILLLSY